MTDSRGHLEESRGGETPGRQEGKCALKAAGDRLAVSPGDAAKGCSLGRQQVQNTK